MSQLEQFGSYTKEAATKARASESTAGWMKMKQGTNIVRILPPLKGMTEPWVTIYQHFIKVPGAKQVVFNCPRRMENKRCPACEKGDRLKATGNPADEKAARDFWASQRMISFAIDRDEMDKGIQLFPFGATIKGRLRHFREKLGKDFTDLNDGFDIVIERMGQGLSTEYQTDLGEQCPVVGDMSQLESWAADLPDLQSFAKVLSYDAIVEKFATAGSSVGGSAPRPALSTGSVQDSENEVDDGSDPY
jgi:hypothetical protein